MAHDPRIDLDGITLSHTDEGETTALLRYRTVEGIVLRLPESVDRMVPWDAIAGATLDLVSGRVRLRFDPQFVARANWLGGASELVGQWTDRAVLYAGDVGFRTQA